MFVVRRIFAAVVFGAQLCAAWTVTEHAATQAQATSPSKQATARMMESFPPAHQLLTRAPERRQKILAGIARMTSEPARREY
jgi:hypothetical protein